MKDFLLVLVVLVVDFIAAVGFGVFVGGILGGCNALLHNFMGEPGGFQSGFVKGFPLGITVVFLYIMLHAFGVVPTIPELLSSMGF